ncbi:TPA: cytochrome P460 family protein [Enterobacter hormaechei subsp. steigerwaltii]|nr:cytochrome P460 family protein [Enterobacter hormaechei subsp. steigerwaltii]
MKKIIALLALVLSAAFFPDSFAQTTPDSENPTSTKIVRATFSPDGAVVLPKDFHHWVHVGTFIKEDGINIFDNSKITAPLIGNTYIEPSAWKYYMSTGKWADGSQIVKEFTEAQAGDNCDNKTTHLCKTPIGAGIFQNNYAGFGFMIKDKARFPTAAGNWGFFTSGHLTPPYPETAKVEDIGKCSACHIAHASDQDYVFAAQKIGLDRASMNNK